jgi:hypothetical protein
MVLIVHNVVFVFSTIIIKTRWKEDYKIIKLIHLYKTTF